MKKSISLVLTVIMVLMLAAGCGSQNSATNETNQQTSATGSTVGGIDKDQYLNDFMMDEPTTLNLFKRNDAYSLNILVNVLEPLVRIDNDVVVPAGAEKWTTSDDGLVWTFTLHDNVWSDGKPVTASDYAYPLITKVDPKTAYAFASNLFFIKNAQAINEGKMDISQLGIKVIDDKTLQITLENKCPDMLTNGEYYPAREDVVKANGDQFGLESNTMVYNGPFVIESWEHRSQFVLKKNSKYWDAGNVKLQTATIKIMSDSNAILNSIDNGSLDYGTVSDMDYAAKFSQRQELEKTVIKGARIMTVFFNTKDKIMSNAKVRQAFSLSLPRQEFCTVIWNDRETPAKGYIPDNVKIGDKIYTDTYEGPLAILAKNNPDPKALLIQGLKELGINSDPSKLKIKMEWPMTNAKAKTMGDLFQQTWKEKLGVTVEMNQNEWGTFLSSCNSGKYQIGYMLQGSNYDVSFLFNLCKSNSNAIPTFYKSSQYDKLVGDAYIEQDTAKRISLYQQAETLLVANDAVLAPVAYVGSFEYKYKYLKGIDDSPFQSVGYKHVYTEGRPAK